MSELHIDALLPKEMAQKAESIGIRKAELSTLPLFALALLAGAFIALGAIFATTVATGTSGTLPYGVTKLLVGLVFCLGLVLVVVGGAELFTGNNLIVMAWASGKISTRALLRNWTIVYLGNFVGSIGTALLIFFSKQYTFNNGGIGLTAMKIANGKVGLGFIQAIALGILCNALVCLAVWMTFSARTTVGKIAAIIFPITAFVAGGFEHSVANMYFIPMGLFIKYLDPAFTAQSGANFPNLTWTRFFINNLLPVTIGNIIGGSILVAAIYWVIYLREN
ncbi:MAG: formate/nitrite transporter family protein [Anaerolineales bacterium]|nr:formate/nitrite transporter family protein [Anaerolineales bacterium]